jgi:hypothetical protein
MQSFSRPTPIISHCLFNSRDNVGIRATAANVPAHKLAHVIHGPGSALGYHPHYRTDLTWRAVPALESVVINERLLQGMERTVLNKPLDGGDGGSLLHDSEREAGIDAAPIDKNRAGPALPMVTSLFRAHKPEVLAQRIKKACPGSNNNLPLYPIDDESHGNRARGCNI